MLYLTLLKLAKRWVLGCLLSTVFRGNTWILLVITTFVWLIILGQKSSAFLNTSRKLSIGSFLHYTKLFAPTLQLRQWLSLEQNKWEIFHMQTTSSSLRQRRVKRNSRAKRLQRHHQIFILPDFEVKSVPDFEVKVWAVKRLKWKCKNDISEVQPYKFLHWPRWVVLLSKCDQSFQGNVICLF